MNTFFLFGAKYFVFVSLVLAGIYFLSVSKDTKKKMLILGIFSFALSFVLAIIARKLYFDPRPFVVEHFLPLIPHAADNGFPSDHTLLAAAIASLIMFFNKHAGICLWLLAAIVGLSRVYVGVHHFKDIIGSGIIALFSALVVYMILKRSKVL